MAPSPKILAFAGSSRKDSYNKKLLNVAAGLAREAGAEVTVADLRDYPMPIYDGDYESENGIPEKAAAFKELMIEHQGLLIASPEYNSSFSALLKNVIDWASRPSEKGETPLIAFNGKFAAIMGASPGGFGGLRGLVHVRSMLSNINVHVIPQQVAIAKAHEAFGEDGSLNDEGTLSRVKSVTDGLVSLLLKV